MATRQWIFLINTFDVNTQDSNKKMLSIATDTEAKLQAESSDPDINAIYTAYFPVYDAYRQIQINYLVASGEHEGQTLNVENLLRDDLPEEIKKWEGFVRSIYTEDSPQERAIFPGKRNPFSQGTYDERISAVGALTQRLANDPNPAVLGYAPTVQSFYNLLFSARDVQQNKEGLLGQLSDIREQQRILLAQELYAALGGLMRKFKSTPEQIARFFDLSLLRETGDEPAQRARGRIKHAETGNPLAGVKGKIMNADGEQVGESFFTDSNGEYDKATDHTGEGSIEFEKANFQKEILPVNIPVNETIVVDVNMQPAPPPPPAE